MKKLILPSLIIALFLVACNFNNKTPSNDTKSVKLPPDPSSIVYNTDWILKDMNGKEVKISPDAPKKAMIHFDKEDHVTGSGGCNLFSGNCKFIDNEKIAISYGAATQMACPEMDIESEFFATLGKAEKYKLDGNKFYLMDKNGTVQLSFTKE